MSTVLYSRSATEAEMLKLFGDLAMGGGGFLKHIRDARRQNVEGLPDVILAVPPVLALFDAQWEAAVKVADDE